MFCEELKILVGEFPYDHSIIDYLDYLAFHLFAAHPESGLDSGPNNVRRCVVWVKRFLPCAEAIFVIDYMSES